MSHVPFSKLTETGVRTEFLRPLPINLTAHDGKFLNQFENGEHDGFLTDISLLIQVDEREGVLLGFP